MGTKRDQPTLGFDMKLSERNLSCKVVMDALGDIHHTPLVDGKDIPYESSIVRILMQSPLTLIRIFAGCPR